METSPIFIIGTERSGSNLLRLILNAHSDIVVPHPPHFLKFFAPLADSYGNLENNTAFKRLVDDVVGLVAVHIYPWEIKIDAEVICQKAPRSLAGVFLNIYDAYLKQTGKRRWGCKSTFVIDHLPEVLTSCPKARFLFLVRDPRDVAASSRQSIFSTFHPSLTARLWGDQQSKGLAMTAKAPENFLIVRYEDLLSSPEITVKKICAFLSEEYEPAMLEFYRTGAAKKSSRLSSSWKNTDAPIQAGNQGKYIKELSRKEIECVERETGELMERFGYQPEFRRQESDRRKPSAYFLLWYKTLDWYWRIRVEILAMSRDANYRLHWHRRLFLLKLRVRCRLRFVPKPAAVEREAG